MVNYKPCKLNISNEQYRKLSRGDKIKILPNLKGGCLCPIDLTNQQIKKIRKSKLKGNGTSLKLSHSQVRHHHKKLRAKGFGSWIKNTVNKAKDFVKNRVDLARQGPRTTEPPQFKNFLAKEGNQGIKSMYLNREPVQSGVQKAINLLTFGEYDKAKKKLGYDDVYHNYMVIETDDGKKFKVEKNHVVQAKETKEKGQHRIPIDKNITVNELIKKGEGGHPQDFYQYNPNGNNCQNFTDKIVKRNDLVKNLDSNTKKILEPQDSKNLLKGPLSALPKVFTDIAGTADRLIHGDGMRRRNKNKRRV